MSGADGGDHLPTWDLTRGYLTSIRIVTTDDVDLWHKKWTTANDELAATRAGRPPAKHDR